MSTLKRSHLETVLSDEVGLTKVQARAAVSAMIDAINGAVKHGAEHNIERPVAIQGLLSIEIGNRDAREARNPRTGEKVLVPAKKVLRIKPGAELKSIEA